MVNELQQIRDVVVKAEIAPESERVVTSRGGHSLVQAVGPTRHSVFGRNTLKKSPACP